MRDAKAEINGLCMFGLSVWLCVVAYEGARAVMCS